MGMIETAPTREPGTILRSPTDVVAFPERVVQPDLFFVPAGRHVARQKAHFVLLNGFSADVTDVFV